MKKFASIALALVLTASSFAGCGCTNKKAMPTTLPTILPTTEATRPTTNATTAPTTHNTVPETTVDRGNGGLEGTTGGTVGPNETTVPAEGKTRSRTTGTVPTTVPNGNTRRGR